MHRFFGLMPTALLMGSPSAHPPTACGLQVLSEVYYSAWKAYVDGREIHVSVTDGADAAQRIA